MSRAERTFQVILSTIFTGTVVVAGVTLIGMGVIQWLEGEVNV